MIISERIIKVLKERNMTQAEFAKQVGISTSTISEWKKRKTNPTVEKIMDICNVLQITPEQLLTGKGIEDEEEIAAASPESKFTPGDIQMIEDYHNLREEQQKRLMAYMEALKKIESESFVRLKNKENNIEYIGLSKGGKIMKISPVLYSNLYIKLDNILAFNESRFA